MYVRYFFFVLADFFFRFKKAMSHGNVFTEQFIKRSPLEIKFTLFYWFITSVFLIQCFQLPIRPLKILKKKPLDYSFDIYSLFVHICLVRIKCLRIKLKFRSNKLQLIEFLLQIVSAFSQQGHLFRII